jgi:ABC-2 type transport system ATP-binding protein
LEDRHAVEIRNLRRDLHGQPILRDVNLSLGKGQIYGLLGPNGAGKSAMISAVTGLRAATSGTVRTLGLDPSANTLRLHRRIGVLAEDAGFYDWMNATGYLRWVASIYGMERGHDEIGPLLERVGLNGDNTGPIST